MVQKGFITSVFMVAGCAMGAGCLAMPMLAAGPNFIVSSIALILTGIYSYLLAGISLEIFVSYKNNTNVSTIVGKNFGVVGVIIAGIVNCLFMYALLSVYMAGGADLLSKTILPLLNIHLSNKMALLIFLVITLPIFLKGVNLVAISNKLIFSIKLLSFLVIIAFGLHFVSPRLASFDIATVAFIPRALPIFLTALWFHILIPVIAQMNNYDRRRIRKIMFVGLAIPVVLYILWVGIMLSLIPRDGVGNTFLSLLQHKESVGTMIAYATHNNPNLPEGLKIFLNVFSNVAMLTSFLAVGISANDYIRDALKIKTNTRGVILLNILVFAPPTFFSIFYPNGFVFILQQAAIMLMLTSVIILLCCLKDYAILEQKPSKIYIYFILLILLALIGFQILDNFNLLPNFGS